MEFSAVAQQLIVVPAVFLNTDQRQPALYLGAGAQRSTKSTKGIGRHMFIKIPQVPITAIKFDHLSNLYTTDLLNIVFLGKAVCDMQQLLVGSC